MMSRGLLREYAFTLSIIARTVDVISILFGAIIAYWWKFDSFDVSTNYQIAILLGIVFTPFIFDSFGIYNSWRGKNQFHHYRTVFIAWVSVIALLILIAFLTKTSDLFSRQWLVAWSISVLFIVIVFRFFLTSFLHVLRNNGLNNRQIAIFGAGQLGQSVLSNLNDATWSGIRICAFFDDNSSLYNLVIRNVAVLGGINQLKKLTALNLFDEIWIALPLRSEMRVREIMKILKNSTVTIRYVPDIFGFRLLNHSINEVAGIPVINISSSPMVGVNRLLKAVEDRFVALLILVLISPILLLIALSIKLTTKGPIIFKQMRHGWDGKTIKIYKFRTMYEHEEENGVVTQAQLSDSRITKLGALLRKTSLDELPQFFNVLQGRMSIVGPRPHAVAHNELYKDLIDNYMKRHKVKPGITGWAQINGLRGETNIQKMRKRVEYDLFYIEHWSIWFDIKIITMTIFHGFVNKNAY